MTINMCLLKQTLGAAIVATLMSSTAAAQGVAPVTVGIKGGLNYSTLTLEDDSLPVKHVLGGVGGVFVRGNLTPNVGMQVEALYSQRGAQDDIDGADAKARLTYIDVPVTFHIGTSTSNGARFHLFTGPQVAYELKSQIINELDGTTMDNDGATKDWDFGWTVGAGVQMQRVTLDARYTHGLTNLNAVTGPTVKSRTMTAMVGVRLW